MDEQHSTKTCRLNRSFIPGRPAESPRTFMPAPVWGRRSRRPPERGVPPHYRVLVWRQSVCPARGPPAGSSGYDLREKSRRLVWPWSSGTHTQVGMTVTLVLLYQLSVIVVYAVNILYLGISDTHKKKTSTRFTVILFKNIPKIHNYSFPVCN